MNRQEAIRALLRAGKKAEAEAIVEKRLSAARSAYERVRSDQTRTEEYRRWVLAVEAARADRQLTEDLAALARTASSSERVDAGRVFGTAGLPGDAASLAISRRDASDRAESANGKEELLDLLSRATRSGDEVLARAVAEVAVRKRHAEVVNAFADDRPDLETPIQRLWNVEGADSGEAIFGFTVAISGLKPAELQSDSWSSINAQAKAAEPGSGSSSLAYF
ncbi:hypothetical protein [Nocardioides bruguierae]|uniref:Uncharacterized protein n=1 Tax=Nocardioides bruguierae TaxID=2945102 RepID=A0A9X2D5N5_9ACTN|nr:hypothetical protein [Nocardioides bruguierae]MCM0618749.1 hypothetical protein [Nocardioides bruguierae]